VPQALANTMWAYATLGRAPEAETWRALETAAVRVAPGMVPQNLANTMWAHVTLGSAPEAETWRALETAAARVAPGMVPQNLANTLWAYLYITLQLMRRNCSLIIRRRVGAGVQHGGVRVHL